MKKSFWVTLIVASGILLGLAKVSRTPAKTVVDLFVKMDVEGARLTPEGWHRADALFAKHGKASQPKVLIVIASRYAVSEKMRNENTAEYYMGYEEVGRIDISSLRFSPSNGGIEMRSFDKYIISFNRF